MPAAPSDNARDSEKNAREPRKTPRGGDPSRADSARTGPRPGTGATAEEKERIKALQELEKVEKQLEELRKKREELLPRTAAMGPPVQALNKLKERRGFSYHTWFKAIGSMESLADLKGGDSPSIINEMMEYEDYDIPSAFYSHSILGKVKWRGVRPLERIIEELNFKGFSGNDFRAIYTRWEYTYRVVESVGDVPVNVFEVRAKQPRTAKDRRVGWKGI